jgi:uncharacterized protein YbjT (DUF2867 family)
MVWKKQLTVSAIDRSGGSVIHHLISSDKPYRIRAITRDSSKPNAKDLASKGVEVVEADLGGKDTLDSAIQDQQYVFVSDLPVFAVAVPAYGASSQACSDLS